jgi:hypothetical protein
MINLLQRKIDNSCGRGLKIGVRVQSPPDTPSRRTMLIKHYHSKAIQTGLETTNYRHQLVSLRLSTNKTVQQMLQSSSFRYNTDAN